MELKYVLPRADLRSYVRAYYLFVSDRAGHHPMCAENANIRFLFDGVGGIGFRGQEIRKTPQAFLIGPTNTNYTISVEANTCAFGIGVRPKGLTLLGVKATDVADQMFDLTSVSGHLAAEAIERVLNAASFDEMSDAADWFFSTLLQRRNPKHLIYPEAIESWLLNPEDLDLDRLMEQMDVSRRQTDRLAKRFFGASPKLLQRKFRALRAADRIKGVAGANWRNVAGSAFYDQSHYIKEFREFVGVTPQQFSSNQAPLISAVQQERKLRSATLPLASF